MDFIKILTESGIELQSIEKYLLEKLQQDRDYFDTVKQYLTPDERDRREFELIHVGILLSLIRRSLE